MLCKIVCFCGRYKLNHDRKDGTLRNIVYGLFTDTATSGRACNQVTKNITCTMQGKLSKYIQLHFYILKNTQRTCMKR